MATTFDAAPTPAAPAHDASAEPRASRVRMPDPPRGTDAIPIAFESIYTWHYDVERADLRALYEKSKDAMWNARTYLPWDTNVDPEAPTTPDEMIPIFGTDLWDKLDKKTELPKLRRMGASYMLSNFLHGEQGALLATSQIVSAVPSADAKLYAATQVMDEARHVEAYDRYLREKVELTFPISPYLRTLLDEILKETRWDMKYLGMQILVEGLALAAFGFISQTSTEPLYEGMSEAELRDREEFILSASRLMRDRFLMQEVWEHMGMPVERCVEISLASPAMQTFRALLFSKIVPNVKRLGLLTPRVRKGFEELGVIQFESWDASA
jgi:hypothetical protein